MQQQGTSLLLHFGSARWKIVQQRGRTFLLHLAHIIIGPVPSGYVPGSPLSLLAWALLGCIYGLSPLILSVAKNLRLVAVFDAEILQSLCFIRATWWVQLRQPQRLLFLCATTGTYRNH